MNNFTNSDSELFWHSITNLICCSIAFRKCKSGTSALMLTLFFSFSIGSMYAQKINLPQQRSTFYPVCIEDRPVGFSEEEIANLYASMCPDGTTAQVVKSENLSGNDCSWITVYTYDVVCGDFEDELKVTYEGGDITAPELTGDAPGSASGLNLCYEDIPSGPTANEIASIYSDDCGNVNVVKSGIPEGTDCNWSVTYTYSIVDDCGNVSPDFQITYSGGDTEAPTLAKNAVLPEGETGLNLCYDNRPTGPSEAEVAALFEDNCGNVNVDKVEYFKGDDCGWKGEIIYTIYDDCGNNTENLTLYYNGGDMEAPEFVEVLDDITVTCIDEIPVMPNLEWTDNCTSGTKGNFSTGVDNNDGLGIACEGGVVIRTWTAVDDCGHSTSVSQTITVLPAPKAEFDEPQDYSIDCGDLATFQPQSLLYTNNVDAGACEISGYAVGVPEDFTGSCGLFTVNYSFTDECGHTITASQTVTVEDNEAPIIDSGKNAYVECDGNGNVEEYNAWLAINGEATATDNCGSITWSYEETLEENCGGTFVYYVDFTATDECGNSSIWKGVFNVEDTTAPELTDAQDMTVECDGQGNVDALNAWLASYGGATASDVCSDISWSNNFEGLSVECGATGSATVEFTVTDSCGNSSKTTATFTIEDTTAPSLADAQDMTVECDGQGNIDALNAWLNSYGGASASDDCGDVTWSNNFDMLSDNCGMTGSATVEFTATDDCGNASITTATFTIEDTNSPPITMSAQDMTVECNGEGNMSEYQAWLDNNGGATAVDICSDITWSYQVMGETDDCGMTKTITVLFTVTDDCGLSSSTEADFIIDDTTSPEITGAQDVTVECKASTDDNKSAEITIEAWLDNNGGATASDLCGNVTWTNNFNGLSDDCGNTGSATVEFTATDSCGNTSKTTATYTIVDTTAPSIEVSASDMTVECDGSGNQEDLMMWLDTYGGASAYDICGDVSWSHNFDMLSDDCGMTGSATVEFTATDDCGNTSKTTATFTIVDTISPSITDAQDMTVECDGSGNQEDLMMWLDTYGGATASDVCGDVIWSNNFDMLSDDCGATGSATVEFTATDDCGNTSKTTATFTIADTTAPSITDAQDMTVECDGQGNYYDLDAWLANNGGATASDACSDVVWSHNFDMLSDDCGATGSATVEFTATDDCGNMSKTTATFTIVDTTAPGFEVAPQDMTVECDGQGNTEDLNAWLASNGGAYAYDICSDIAWSNNFDMLSNDCGATGSATVEFTVTDDCGNETKATATFTIEDTTNPSIDYHSKTEVVECDGQGNIDELTAWLANNGGAMASDYCGNVSWSNDFNGLSDECGMTGSVTVVFTVADECGNTSKTQADFIIEDTTAPELNDAQDMTVECDGQGNLAELNAWLDNNGGAIASDICGDVTWSNNFDDLSDDCGATGSATVEFTATDDCGNMSKTTATFTIEDTAAPIINEEAKPEIVECDGQGNLAELNAWLADNGGATASDICGDVTWSYSEVAFSDDCGLTGTATVVFTATDACGNTNTTTSTFTIEDTTSPEITEAQDETVECSDGNIGGGDCVYIIELIDSYGDGWNGNSLNVEVDGVIVLSGITVDDGYSASFDIPVTHNDAIITVYQNDGSYSYENSYALFDSEGNEVATGDDDNDIEYQAHCPQPSSQELYEAWLANHGGATASDLCGNVTWTNNASGLSDECGLTGSETVEFTATDACGNTSKTTATFTIIDTSAPVITAQAEDMTVECNASGENCNYSVVLSDTFGDGWNGNTLNIYVDGELVLENATLEDGFEGESMSFEVTNGGTISTEFVLCPAGDFSCWPGETSYTIYDSNGNEVASVEDGTPMADLTAECSTSDDLFAAWLANNAGAMANDYCGDITWSNNSQGLSDDCGATGSETVTFTVTDECGNTSSSTATFTIIDTTAPTIDVEADDMLVECDGSGNQEDLMMWLDTYGGATASDSCSDVSWSNNFNGLSDECGMTGSATVIFTATDECGNTSTTEATFTIQDTEDPIMEYDAKPEVVECDGQGNLAQLDAWLADNGGAKASDACSDVSWSYSDVVFSDDCGLTGSATVVFTATDDCGNYVTTEATFTIQDTTAPNVVDAQDMTVECDGQGNSDDLYSWLESNGGATASDACSEFTWSNNFEALSDDCGMTGSVTVEFTATDECGNSAMTTATFTIEDTTSPYIDYEAKDMTVECDGQGNQAELNAWLASNGGAYASDICSDFTWSNNFNGLSDDCGATGSATVEFTATDECGNESKTTATFTILDTENPSIDNEAVDMTVECDGQGNLAQLDAWLANNGGAMASDTCSGVVWSYNNEMLSDDCAATGSVTVEFTATDDCGNTSKTTATFTIEDTTAPVLVGQVPQGESNVDACFDMIPQGPTEAEIAALFYEACGEVVVEKTGKPLGEDCSWAVMYSYAVSDECGNPFGDVKVWYNGGDISAPTFNEELPMDMTVECNAVPSTAVLTATDNCADVVVEFDEQIIAGDCKGEYTIINTWSVADNCGNATSHTQTITVVDTMAPVLIGELPTGENQINACLSGAPEGPTEEEMAALFSDACGDVIVVKETQTWGDDCSWIVNHEYSVYDDCGNMYDGLIKVYYQGSDQSAPEFDVACQLDAYEIAYDCPVDATISLAVGDEIDPQTGWTVAGEQILPLGSCVNDNCTLNKDIILRVMDITYGGDSCETDISVSFEAEDACGNISEDWFTCTYVIKDDTAPVVDCPNDQDFGIDPALDAEGVPVGLADKAPYTDNCQGDGMTYAYSDEISSSTSAGSGDMIQFYTTSSGWYIDYTLVGYDSYGYPMYEGVFNWPVQGIYGNSLSYPLTYNHTYSQWEAYQSGTFLYGQKTLNNVPSCDLSDWFDCGCLTAPLSVINCSTGQGNIEDYTLVRTFTANDGCGNVGECSVTYTWTLDNSYNYPPAAPQTNSGNEELYTATSVPSQSAPETPNIKVLEEDVKLDFRAYPVPFNKEVTIGYNFDFETNVTIEVYDTKGLLVMSETNNTYRAGSDASAKLDLSNGADQLFYVTVTTSQGSVTKKIVSSTLKRR